MSITYSSYLQLDALLSLQKEQAVPAAEDELLFITVHQTHELWFKQLLHESKMLRTALNNKSGWLSARKMRRMLTILKLLVKHSDVLETMTPRHFASFRDFLARASGLQSYQFRAIEIVCGWRHATALYEIFTQGTKARESIDMYLQESTMWECFCAFLATYEPNLPALQRSNVPNTPLHLPCEKRQASIVALIQKHHEIDILVELFVDFDEGMQEWRYRHVKMVERTIGSKPGTGNSTGVDYLKAGLHRQLFPDLWAVRQHF